jgi:DNA-binding CsgD family transcriptional regulator
VDGLTSSDFSALLSLLKSIYELRDLPAFRAHVVSAIPKLVPSEITTYNEIDPTSQRTEWIDQPAHVLDFQDGPEIFGRHIHEHPLISNYSQTGDDRVLKISDFINRNQLHQLGLYQDFFRRVDVEDQMVIVLPALKPLVIAIALNRHKRNFTERERLLVSLLRPNLVAAYKNAQTVTAMAEELASTKLALRRSGSAAVVLSRDGHVLSTSALAQELWADYFDVSRAADGLPDVVRRWTKHRDEALTGIQAPSPLVVDKNEKRLTVRVVPDGDRILLLLTEELTEMRPEALAYMGLTRREADVLTWVARGKTNLEIAVILEISGRTAQKHLEHVFQKLGVESRTSAAACAWEAMKNSGGMSD